jgi:Ca2+-binding EF-hand superfamily protein
MPKGKNIKDFKFHYGILLKEAVDRLEYDITNNKLKNAFMLFDMDGNGTISLEEI